VTNLSPEMTCSLVTSCSQHLLGSWTMRRPGGRTSVAKSLASSTKMDLLQVASVFFVWVAGDMNL
jgi:hypothetical protein